MVIKYTKGGAPYLALPYTEAEKAELFRGLNDTPTVVGRYRKPQDQPQPQPPQAGPPRRDGERP